ncbi:MAG: hypothetical protein NTX33_17865 [Propionibacteriales bacterium]|nr:hypothetical protein [Propionibacteriales bacterium]
MPDQDPIDKLSRFGAGFSSGTGGDMPLSAADVRRRGDQIRRRRTALVAGASALAVAAVAVPIFAVVGGNPKAGENDKVADDPQGALSTNDLLRDDDTEYFPNEKSAFRTVDTYEGDGQATFHPCQQATLASLGATTSFTRTFEYVVQLEAGDTAPPDAAGDGLVETVAEFEDDDDARAAYDTFAGWILDCESRLGDFERVNVVPQARAVALPAGAGDAKIYDLNWGPVEKSVDPYGDASYINETGLVLRGDRIAVVGLTIVGQDYNFLEEDGGTPVNRMVPVAADRLRPGGDTPAQPSETLTEPASTVDPAIADDFPLSAGWPADDGSDVTAEGPNRTLPPLLLNVCDADVEDAPAPQDRLVATWSQPEDYRTRQLSTYASEDQAAAALGAVVSAYRDCPEEPSSPEGYVAHHVAIQSAAGDESWVVGTYSTFDGADAIGIEVIHLIRIGTALLVITGSNEGSAPEPESTFLAAGDQMANEASNVVSELCAFTEPGC